MVAKDIKGRESLRTWLSDRPREDALCIANRSAQRALPLWAAATGKSWARQRDLTALPILRMNLTSGVAAVSPTPEVRAAASAADAASAAAIASHSSYADSPYASYAVADAAASAAYASAAAAYAANAYVANASAADAAAEAAAYAANAAAEAAPFIWDHIRWDAGLIEQGRDPFAVPLWTNPTPEWFEDADAETQVFMRSDPTLWDFWQRWWNGVKSGNQLDWALQEQVALIPDDIWQSGPGPVAAAIAEIEDRHLRTKAAIRLPLDSGDRLLLAHVDFSYDMARQMMRMLPFDQDISRLNDPATLARLLNDSADFQTLLQTVVAAADASGRQSANAVKTFADHIKVELDHAAEFKELRVGVLIDLGEGLQDFAGDENIRLGLGPALPKSLDRATDRLLDLIRNYFAPALARISPLSTVTLGPDEKPRVIAGQVDANLRAIIAHDGTRIPALTPEDQAVLERLSQELRASIRNHEAATDPEVKKELGDIVARKALQLSWDQALYIKRGVDVFQALIGAKDDNVADAIMRRYLLAEKLTDAVDFVSYLISVVFPMV